MLLTVLSGVLQIFVLCCALFAAAITTLLIIRRGEVWILFAAAFSFFPVGAAVILFVWGQTWVFWVFFLGLVLEIIAILGLMFSN